VVIDVGAGRGEDEISFSRDVGHLGRVIAIEANPISFRLLRKFCDVNSLGNVVPVHAAIVSEPRKMYVTEAASGNWQEDTVNSTGEGVAVDGVTLDQLCLNLGIKSVSFLKMNIEGAERDALSGMQKTLSMTKVLCVCCHDFRADRGESDSFRTAAFVKSFLAKNEFEIREFPYHYVSERDHIHAVRR
jgi:FkbM family methyltransferase